MVFHQVFRSQNMHTKNSMLELHRFVIPLTSSSKGLLMIRFCSLFHWWTLDSLVDRIKRFLLGTILIYKARGQVLLPVA